MKRLGYHKTMSFSEFVELTCNLSVDAMDVHTQPQTFLIRDSKGKLPDFIGCIESLGTDWRRLSEHMVQRDIPINRKLPHLNISREGEGNQSQSIRLPEHVQHQFE